MSVIGSVVDGPGGGRGGKTILAELPLHVPGRRPGRQKTPQQKIDDFWKKFTTKAPGMATTIIPHNPHVEQAAKRELAKTVGSGTTVQGAYEEAAALCRAKVDRIVKECKRINQKYRDRHFDLEFDLKLNSRDCLESLDNTREPDSDSEVEQPTHRERPRSRDAEVKESKESKELKGGQNGGTAGKDRAAPASSLPKDGHSRPTHDRSPGSNFRPGSVKRVDEIFDEPRFYIEGATANDVRQGRDGGDCWLMAALCTLSNKPGLIERICVAQDEKVGVYGFVFHRDGEWISEIIDDKLYLKKPDYDEVNLERLLWEDRDRVNSEETYKKTYQTNSGALYFAQCENPNETWLPLLEKAYAKAHGDYAAIEGGFNGEGIEDLTGGVTSELFTTDILDKEYFWKEELLKVNDQFLFGCSTGVWGRGWGERNGIVELHAYSVMRAVEIDGERLVLLKNPWGKGEWKGAWSDGSKEWTPEWLQKLNHRFGDDGAFWISYKDLLRKYQAFDRTRLFGPDWKVNSIWTTLHVPWTLEYHSTKFAFTLEKPGPVVLVLSQLDDRYFRGLEGQYRFELSFRLHVAGKDGEDDEIVRSQASYRMNRSVNVELELEAGEYQVFVKIDTSRDEDVEPVEKVVRDNVKERHEKLMRIGLSYDIAHAKGKVVETAEEKEVREKYDEHQKKKTREQFRKRYMESRHREHYMKTKQRSVQRRRLEKKKAKQKAREEERRARDGESDRSRSPSPAGSVKRESGDENSGANTKDKKPKKEDGSAAEGEKPGKQDLPKDGHVKAEEPAATSIKEESGKDSESTSTGPGAPTPSASNSSKESADTTIKQEEQPTPEHPEPEKKHPDPDNKASLSPEASFATAIEDITPDSEETEKPEPRQDAVEGKRSAQPSAQETTLKEAMKAKGTKPAADTARPERENIVGTMGGRRTTERRRERSRRRSPGPPIAPGLGVPIGIPRGVPLGFRGPPHPPPFYSPPGGMSDRGRGYLDDDLDSVTSVSDISERELDFELELVARRRMPGPPPPLPPPFESDDEFERDPWNAVVVVGLRVYHKVTGEEDKDKDLVKLRVVRPNRYVVSEDEKDKQDAKPSEKDGSNVLDLDDSAKDATLAGVDDKGTLIPVEDAVQDVESGLENVVDIVPPARAAEG